MRTVDGGKTWKGVVTDESPPRGTLPTGRPIIDPIDSMTIYVVDPDNPYKAIMIRGRVANISTEGADAHIDRMAKKYLGKDKYPFRNPKETRVIYRIEPQQITSMG